MGTPFAQVIDLSLTIIRDWRLDKLFDEDEEAFVEVMSGYLVKAIPKFAPSCRKSLAYNFDTKEFEQELDMCEIDILADWTCYMHLQDLHNDVLEMRAALSSSDFKRIEQAALLKSRTAYLEYLRRKIKIDTNNYQFQFLDSYFGGDADA